MVCSEWLPEHGGLPRFNKDLGAALAGQGHDVSSTALRPRLEDYADARAHRVSLVVPDRDDLVVRPSQVSHGVDVVVGHARKAFAPAVAQARRDFPAAGLAMVVHTVPEELAPFRQGTDLATARQEADAKTGAIVGMCQGADVVYGVGPHLTEYWQDKLGRPVRELVPGAVDTAGGPVAGPPAGERRVLLMGRMQDWQIKGVDIAASAFAHVPDRTRDSTRFVVMGTPEGTESELTGRLHGEYGIPAAQIDVKEYSADPQDVLDQLRRASVLVMPSRAEGYGLVAHEAVSMGVPVLASDRSGFGQLLGRHGEGQHLVVPVTGDLGRDQKRWADALSGALEDRPAYFGFARSAREHLATWPQVAQHWTDGVHQARARAVVVDRREASVPVGPSVDPGAVGLSHQPEPGRAPGGAPETAPGVSVGPAREEAGLPGQATVPRQVAASPSGLGLPDGQRGSSGDRPSGAPVTEREAAVRTAPPTDGPAGPPLSPELQAMSQRLQMNQGSAGAPGPASSAGSAPSARPPRRPGLKNGPGAEQART